MGGALRETDGGVMSNPDGFRTQIAEPCVPGVLRGACRDWPARRAGEDATAALFAYLRRFDSGATGQAFVGARGIGGRYHYGQGPDGFNFARETLGLGGLLSRIEGARDDHEHGRAACRERGVQSVVSSVVRVSLNITTRHNRLKYS